MNKLPSDFSSISLTEFRSLGLDKYIGKKRKNARPTHQNPDNPKKRQGKYNAIKTEVDGITFDSKFEATRYSKLKLMLKAGIISELKLQVKYPLAVNDCHIANYIADFTYYQDNKLIVEDAKGVKTTEYKLKKKLLKAIHGIDILETYAAKI